MPNECDQCEIWRPHPEFSGYEVSTLGQVRSVDRVIVRNDGTSQHWKGRLLKAVGPYPYVTLCDAGRERAVRVHRLVLETFVGPRPAGMQCRHLDGNKRNNRLENLAWGTSAENTEDKRRHGTIRRGERSYWARLNESDVIGIRSRFASGQSKADIALEFGVSSHCIHDIVTGRTWKHI